MPRAGTSCWLSRMVGFIPEKGKQKLMPASWSALYSRDGLQIRLHHSGNSAHLSGVP
jgi:hypothetical protein